MSREIKNKKKYYTVYKTTNTIDGKEYIGFHSTNNLDDGYLGSGKWLKRAVAKYGKECFIKVLIAVFDNQEDAEKLERHLVNEEFVKSSDNYNITVGGNVCILFGEDNGFYGKKHTDETLTKIQQTRGTYNHTEETKKLISEKSKEIWTEEKRQAQSVRMIGYNPSEETRKKLSYSLKGKIKSEEHRHNLSISKKNLHQNMTPEQYDEWYEKTFTPERNEKLSKSLTGRKMPEETINKINRNPEKIRKTAEKHRGMKRSEEAKRNMSNAMKGKNAPNKGKVYCYDPSSLEKKLCVFNDIPDGWVRGFVPKGLK